MLAALVFAVILVGMWDVADGIIDVLHFVDVYREARKSCTS